MSDIRKSICAVYIHANPSRSTYVGVTQNLERRIFNQKSSS